MSYQSVVARAHERRGSRGVSIAAASLASVVLLASGQAASAIVINDFAGPATAQAFAQQFDSVAALQVGCTGTLIAPNVVLAARHCGVFPGSTIRFGSNSLAPSFIATVDSVINPAGSGSLLDGGDVAILTLTGNVPSSIATPVVLTDDTFSLVGSEAITVGYGFNGVGSFGHGFSSDGRRWAGTNIIDRYGLPAGAAGTNIFSTDFDNGTLGANTIPGSSASPLPLEATTAPGDSGGPLFVDYGGTLALAGVLSGGTTSTSVYGDISWWTGIGAYRQTLESLGAVFIPAPSGALLIGVGALAFARRRRAH